MTVKLTLDNLDNLDESVAKLYKKTNDGKYVLDVEAANPVTEPNVGDITRMHGALEKERGVSKSLKVELAAFKALGVTPDDLSAIIAGAKKVTPKAGEANPDADAAMRELQSKHATAILEKDKQIDVAKATVRDALVQSQLTSALTKAGFTATGLKAIPVLHPDRVKVSEVNGVNVIEAMNSVGLPYLPKEGESQFDLLASELATTYPDMVSAERRGGAGTVPGTGVAGSKATISETEFFALSIQDQANLMAPGKTTIT